MADTPKIPAKAEERLHPVLSNEEVLAAREQARKKIEAERRKAMLKAVEEEEAERLRVELGMVTGGPGDEIVDMTINLPPYTNFIRVNMNTEYWHGHTYQVPRHVANSVAEMVHRAWYHDAKERLGQTRAEFYQQQRKTELRAINGPNSRGQVINGPQKAA